MTDNTGATNYVLTAPPTEAKWMRENGLKELTDRWSCLHQVAGARNRHVTCQHGGFIQPWMDHPAFYRDGGSGEVVAFTSQPYHLTEADIQDLDRVTKELGLKLWMSALDSWAPGTILIQLKRGDQKIGPFASKE